MCLTKEVVLKSDIEIRKSRVKKSLDFAKYYGENVDISHCDLSRAEINVLCPFHDDSVSSMSVNIRNGLFCCHSCGAKGDVFAFHQKKHGIGFMKTLSFLESQVSMTGESDGEIVYTYRDLQGNVLYEVVKTLDASGKKKIYQRQPDGKGGFISNLDGIEKVLFNLPSLAHAEVVYLAEGEKDAMALIGLDLVGTCNPGGAGKWKDEYSSVLAGKSVVILADNDDPGIQHANRVAESLYKTARDVKLITFDELPKKGDVSDWLEQGHSKEDLLKRVEMTPFWTLQKSESDRAQDVGNQWEFITGGDFLDTPVEHRPLIDGLLGCGESLLLVGGSGIGKSVMTLNMGLDIGRETDRVLWGHYPMPLQTKTLFIQAENSDASVQQRIKMMCRENPALEKSARENLLFPRFNGSCRVQGHISDPKFMRNLRHIVSDSGAGLVVIDPLISFAGCDENDNTKMRAVLDQLGELMDSTGASVILVHHLGKTGSSGMQGGRGAQAISDWAANIVKVEKAKGSDDGRRFVVEHQKARNYEIRMRKFELTRGDNLMFMPCGSLSSDANDAKITNVISALEVLGGHAESQTVLTKKMNELHGVSNTEAQRQIKLAVERGAVLAVEGKGRSTGYQRVPERIGIAPLEHAEAA